MTLTNNSLTRRGAGACVRLAAVVISFAAGSALAKTPDGMPPSEETVCSGLSGAAFGLCNAYCEAQDCDVHARPSCPVLRRNFEKITGSPVFPCDQACGDGTIQRGEDCDPPGSGCSDGRTCNPDCTCPEPFCGDEIVDPGEQCDPPGSLCTTGIPCSDDCTCETEPGACCECVGTAAPICQDNLSPSACIAQPGCTVGAPGTTCSPEVGRCVGACCQCPLTGDCMTVASPNLCPADCVAFPIPSFCAAGACQTLMEPVP